MSVVTVIPISIEHVFSDDGTAVKGASITEASFVDGVFWKKEVKHLADSTLAGVAAFQTAFNSSIVAQRDALAAEVATLQTKIASLLTEVNFDPRVISSDAFFARLTGKELFALGNSKDAMTMQIAALFDAYQVNKWRIEFDSVDYINPIGYLISQGVLSDERAKEISQDATRSEAYKVPK